MQLQGLEVEEVWDRADPSRHGYVEPSKIADEMIERVLNPFLQDLTHCQPLGMSLEGGYQCMALLQGLYEFQQQSKSPFKDWATDLPIAYAEIAMEKWLAGERKPSTRKKLREFIEENLLEWEVTLVRLLATGAER